MWTHLGKKWKKKSGHLPLPRFSTTEMHQPWPPPANAPTSQVPCRDLPVPSRRCRVSAPRNSHLASGSGTQVSGNPTRGNRLIRNEHLKMQNHGTKWGCLMGRCSHFFDGGFQGPKRRIKNTDIKLPPGTCVSFFYYLLFLSSTLMAGCRKYSTVDMPTIHVCIYVCIK